MLDLLWCSGSSVTTGRQVVTPELRDGHASKPWWPWSQEREDACMLSHVQLLRPHRLKSASLLCPWDSAGKNTRVGCDFLLQGIFPIQGSNPSFLHYRQILYHWDTRETGGKTAVLAIWSTGWHNPHISSPSKKVLILVFIWPPSSAWVPGLRLGEMEALHIFTTFGE